MLETKTELYFIVNPRAGSGKTMSKWVPAEKELDRLGIRYVTEFTDHKRHATSLAYEAADKGYRKIIAVGGDGSLHETFSGIIKWCDENSGNPEEFHLGVVPIGSGNDWIKSFDIPNDSEEAVNLIVKDSYTRMDIVRVKSADGKTYCLANCGGVGFDSHVCKRVNFLKERGFRSKLIYLNALRHTALNLNAIDVKVIADGKEVHSGPVYSIAIGNGKYSGSGMRQVPLAEINDGMIDVMIVPKIPLTTVFRQIPRLFNGTLTESREVKFARCRNLEIVPMNSAAADFLELDGEVEGRLPVSIYVEDGFINALKA